MKTNIYIGTSLDGYIAREDGNIDWLVRFGNDELMQAYKEFIAPIDAIVIGRGTYDTISGFSSWPYDRPVFILSSSLQQLPDVLSGKASLLSLPPKEVLDHLAERNFSNIYIDGGKVIQSFLAADLVDELIVSTLPILIGKGIPLFGRLNSDLSLKLLQIKSYSNGIVKHHYERVRE